MRENVDQNNSEYGHFLRSVFDFQKSSQPIKLNCSTALIGREKGDKFFKKMQYS